MSDKKKVTGIIQIYSKKARQQIIDIGMQFFQAAGISEYAEDVFACVDELIKNAVKANYKFLLIADKLRDKLLRENGISSAEVEARLSEMIKSRDAYDQSASEIAVKEDISDTVREILNEESKYLSIKNRIFDEDRTYTEEEKRIITNLKKFMKIRKNLREKNIRILMKVEADQDYIYIEVTNTAPIMTHDLNRIYDKRDEYRHYREIGREYEFFINNIDTSDSGFGLGYAKIDSFLANMGLDTESSVTIVSANSTTAMLSLPLNQLR